MSRVEQIETEIQQMSPLGHVAQFEKTFEDAMNRPPAAAGQGKGKGKASSRSL
jgi:hypothetical protein